MPNSYTLLSNTMGISAVVLNSKCLAVGLGGFRASNVDTIIANIAGMEITIPCAEVANVNGSGPAATSAGVLSAIGTGFDLNF